MQPTRPERTRSPWLIPLVALSATLVVLVAAIVTVVVVRAGGPRSGGGPVVDSCVVGTWKATAYQEDVPVTGAGPVRFTGEGFEVRLRADGAGVTDYHDDGTTFRATDGGVRYSLLVTGSVRYTFRTGAGSVSFADLRAAGSERLTNDDTGQHRDLDLQGSTDPASYRCAGDTLSEFTGQYRVELTRVSRTA